MIASGFMYIASLTLFAGIVASLEMKYKDTAFFRYIPTPVILYVPVRKPTAYPTRIFGIPT